MDQSTTWPESAPTAMAVEVQVVEKGSATTTHLAIEDSWETEYVQTFEELFYVRVEEVSYPYVPFGSSPQVLRIRRPLRASTSTSSTDTFLHTDVFMISAGPPEEPTEQPATDDGEPPEGITQISAGPEVYGNE